MPELLVPGAFGTDAQATPVSREMQKRNKSGRRPLTPFERQNIENGKLNPIYIYNVSPIHVWPRPQGQLGTITIPKRRWEEIVSDPAVVPGVVVRWVKKGITSEEPFIEGGMEIAEDICGCSPRYDVSHPNSNLTRYGVFICTRPFDVDFLPEAKRQALAKTQTEAEARRMLGEWLVPKSKQKELIAEAIQKLLEELQFRILEGDNWFNGGQETRKYINGSPFHREVLKAFNAITGKKEARPWAQIAMGETLESCPFCGNMGKPGIAKCPNCHEIINKTAYDALKKELGV